MNTLPTSDTTLFHSYLQGLFAWAMTQTGEDRTVTEAAQMQAIKEMAPQDALEAALICQMIASNHQAFTLLAKAQRATSPDSAKDWLNLANRFLSTYAKQIEALSKYQRKGKQTVVVEYMHAAAGSQVLVGNVETSRGKGR
jgi:endo-alpha-1,4-polygalactosaminidase (GH114 family)